MQIGTAQACLWVRRREVAAFWVELKKIDSSESLTMETTLVPGDFSSLK